MGGFALAAQKAAVTAGVHRHIAAQFAAALGEMVSNTHVGGAVNRLLTEPTACSTHCSTQRAGEEMGMDDMDEIRMILAVRVLRKLLNKSDRGDGGELVAAYRALGEAIVENKPMTRKNRARVAEYLREAGCEAAA